MRIVRRLLRLLPREQGQTLVEYALIIALVAIAAVVSLSLLSGSINSFISSVSGAFGG